VLFKKYNVHVIHSNFALYSEMSYRVMEELKKFSPICEVYSVDEAFLHFDSITEKEAQRIRRGVFEVTRIPVSIGIASTKTLCKAANFFAKQRKELQGVCVISEEYLKELPVDEVWGIGKKLAERLRKKSIYTAFDLTQKSDEFLKKELSVIGLRLTMELRGFSCLSVQEMRDPKKSISCARSFKKPLDSLEQMAVVLSRYTANIATELREEKQLATMISVWITTNPFGKGEQYSESASAIFSEPTAFTPTLIQRAKSLLQTIYKEGFIYKKVGVMLSEFVPENAVQQDFFTQSTTRRGKGSLAKQKELMKIMDDLNQKFGPRTISLASELPLMSRCRAQDA